VLVRYGFHASPNAGIVGGVHADVAGEELDDRTASGRWPSDHAGVVVTLHTPKAVGKGKKGKRRPDVAAARSLHGSAVRCMPP
jgi:hypothetical protein